MPVRNAAGTVAAAIGSVQAQSLADWELIVVDDGSLDDTPAILQRFALLDPRIRVLTTPPRGIAEALAAGSAMCSAPFIARMDADDLMHSDRLALQRAHLLEHPQTGLVSCRISYGGTSAGYAAHVDWVNSLLTPEAMNLRRFVEAPVAHPSVMFRRELLDEPGGYRAGAFPEDYELWLRWLECGVVFAKLPETLLVWNDPPQRLSRIDQRYSIEAFYRLKVEFLARWLRRHVDGGRLIWLWGAGRITRRRFDSLADHGIRIAGFIDVDPAKAGRHRDGRIVRLAGDLPAREEAFILCGVAARGARKAIHRHLVDSGRMEGIDFLLAA